MFRLDGVLVKTRTKLFSGDKFSAAAKDLNETNRLTQRISAGDHPYKTRGPTGQQKIIFIIWFSNRWMLLSRTITWGLVPFSALCRLNT